MSDFDELFGDVTNGGGAPELTLVAMFKLVDPERALIEVDRLELFREFFRALTGIELSSGSTTFSLAWADTTQRQTIYAQDIFMDTAHRYEPARAAFSQLTVSLRGKVKVHLLTTGAYEAVAFKPDGTRIFRIANDDRIYSHLLTTPWDLSTIVTGTSISAVQAVWVDAIDLKFSADGLWVYVFKINSTVFYYAPLSVAWDVTTIGTWLSRDPGTGTNIGAGDFSSDGLNFYYLSGAGNIYKSEMSSAWNPGTMAQASTANLQWSDTTTRAVLNWWQLYFTNSGSKLWFTNFTGSIHAVGCVDLATPFSPASAIVSTFHYRTSQEIVGTAQQYMSVHIAEDGKKLFFVTASNNVRSIELEIAGDLYSVEAYPQAGIIQSVSSSIRTPSGLAQWSDLDVSECGHYMVLQYSNATNSTCVSMYTPTPWSFSSLEFLGTFSPGADCVNPSFSPDGRFFTLTVSDGSYRQWPLGQPFNVGTVVTNAQRSLNPSTGNRFNKTRLRYIKGMSKIMYFDTTEDLIYTADTELDGRLPGSSLFTSSKQQFSTTFDVLNFYMSPDGKRVIGFRNGAAPYEWSLSTPYDITTAKLEDYLSNVFTLSMHPSFMNLRNMRDFYYFNGWNAASNPSVTFKINAKPRIIL